MKKVTLLALLLAAFAANAQVYVQPHVRSDGTLVQGHYRSAPNEYRYDNYSARGNANPYTGQAGSQRSEWTSPPAYNKPNYPTNYPTYPSGYPQVK